MPILIKSPLKILILEDSATDAEIIQRVIKKSNHAYTFFVASSKTQYNKALKTFQPDVILSDKSLPQFDGAEALRITQKYSADIPFIMVSGTVSEEYSADIIKMGADDFLLKEHLSRLPAAIDRALKQKSAEKEKRLAIERNRLKAELLNTIAQAVMATDVNSTVNFWNNAATKIYGWTEEEAIGKNIFKLWGIEKFYESENELIEGLRQGNHWSGELIVRGKYGNPFPVFLTSAPFYDDQNNFCGTIGVSADISERKKTEEELKELNSQLHVLSGHLENVREKERMQVAKELHDELAQQLTGLKMDALWLFKKLDIKDEAIRKKSDDMINLIDGTLKSVRRILSNLRPAILDDLGLIAALEWHSEEVDKTSGIRIDFKSSVQELAITKSKSTGLFRIYQEILSIIIANFNASTISSYLTIDDNSLILKIKNDGQETKNKEESLAFISIKERTYTLGGTYQINAEDRVGTEIRITIPLS